MRPSRRNSLPLFAAVAVLLLAWDYAFHTAFTRFAPYDDEGYLRFVVDQFNAGASLYTDLPNHYGPFFYLSKYVLHEGLSAPLTTSGIRYAAIAAWIASAGAIAWFVWRESRSVMLSASVALLLVPHLSPLANEPSHPQEVVLLGIGGFLLATTWLHARARRAGFAMGAVVAALLLTKLNVGGLLLLAALLLLSLGGAARGTAGRVRWALCAVTSLLPVALLGSEFEMPWARSYAAIVVCGLASTMIVAWPPTPRSTALRDGLPAALVGGCTVALLSIGFVLLRGTTLPDLVWGLLVAPARFPAGLTSTAAVHGAGGIAAIAAPVAAIALLRLRRRRQALAHSIEVAAKSGFALAAGIVLLEPGRAGAMTFLTYFTPWLWLVLTGDAASREPRHHLPRLALCLVATLQALQAYPVAGSQIHWATFLVVPAAAICLSDVLHAARATRLGGRSWAVGIGTAWLAVSLAGFLPGLLANRALYRESAPLRLDGTDGLRLLPARTGLFHGLVANLRAHCDSLLTTPGYLSLHAWSSLPAPLAVVAGSVVSRWRRPDPAKQAVLARALEPRERACAVRNASAEHPEFANTPVGETLRRHFAAFAPGPIPLAQLPPWARMELLLDRTRTSPPVQLLHDPLRFGPRTGAFQLPFSVAMRSHTVPSSLHGWVRARSHGVVLGFQDQPLPARPARARAALFIDAAGRLVAELAPGATASSQRSILDPHWHHFAITDDGHRAALYLDGDIVDERPSPPQRAALPYGQLGTGWRGDDRANGADRHDFEGTLVDIAFEHKALTAPEVSGLFHSGPAGGPLPESMPDGRSASGPR